MRRLGGVTMNPLGRPGWPRAHGGWRQPRLLARPEEGWTSLLLLLGMLAVLGLSVADARSLAIDGESRTGPLVLTTVGAGLVGFVLARSTLGLVKAHAVGAAIGAVVLLFICSGAVNEGRTPALDVAALRQAMGQLSDRLGAEVALFLGDAQEPPTTLTLFLLGAMLWTSGQASAFAVFRQQRAAPVITATGGLLVLNEALPALEPAADRIPMLLLLAAWSGLALLLIVRLQLLAQRRQWARRHISDSGEVSRLFLRSGVLFVAFVITAATTLTALASMPAQRVDLDELGRPFDGLRSELARWLAIVAVEVPGRSDVGFGERLDVPDTWQPGQGVAFEARLEGRAGLRGNYWWGAAFADFDGHTWDRAETSEDPAAAEEPLSVPADASGAGEHEITAALTPRASQVARSTVLAPSEVALVSEPVTVRSLGDREGLNEIVLAEPLARGEDYVATSFAHDYRPRSGSLTASQLRAAGTDYPAWIDRYLEIRAGASGQRTRDLARQIATRGAAQGLETPFDLASRLQSTLRRAPFEYSADVSGQCREDESVPECLLRTRAGFCLHYASTMAMVLRELEVPARLVSGYLPGVDQGEGSYRVPLAALHAWVEVYFPNVGWVRFDPTPGSQLERFDQLATELAEGEPLASPGPFETLTATAPPATEPPALEPSPSPLAEAVGASAGGSPDLGVTVLGALGAAAVVLLVVAVLLAVRLRRLPRPDGTLAFGRITSLAARLGYGRAPTQTEYEYAASLSEALPSVREDLFVVAHASVEQRYGLRTPGQPVWSALRRAYTRIRMALLRLALRR